MLYERIQILIFSSKIIFLFYLLLWDCFNNDKFTYSSTIGCLYTLDIKGEEKTTFSV